MKKFWVWQKNFLSKKNLEKKYFFWKNKKISEK